MKKLIIAITVLAAAMVMTACEPSQDAKKAPEVPVTEEASAAAEKAIDTDAAQARREILQKYRFDDSVHQMMIVSHTEGWNADVSFYEKAEANDAWTLVFDGEAYIGKNGMNKSKEGDTKTPCGDYEILQAFGILPNPGTALDYIDITPDSYACDEDCEYYNQIVDINESGHACSGEEMFKLCPEYNYGLTTSYNMENKYPDGSAIFIHCKGQKPFTGGCVALDEQDMKTVLEKAEPGMHIYLDEFYLP